MAYNVLICDDDVDLLDSLEIYLKLEGYNTFRATTGKKALSIVEKNDIHCVILDVMMPETDGLSTTLMIRSEHNLPIILLSAKSEDTDKITGLSFGADDYITKPYNPLELVARVKSQIRRYTSLGSMVNKDNIISTGGLCLDLELNELFLDGEPVHLTATELKIVRFLMDNLGKVMPSEKIYEAVWNEPACSAEKTVTVHIRRIREKIEINPKEPVYLKVVWGIGYKIEKI